jgi:phosphoglycolate phosphatase
MYTGASNSGGTVGNAELVILDLDGTLYSSTATTLGAVVRAVDDLNGLHGHVASLPSNRAILSAIGSTREQFAQKVFPDLPAEYLEEIDGLIWHWERTLVDDGNGSLFPGAVRALKDMKSKGLKLAVATNAGRGYMSHILDYFEIRRYFDDTRCAGDERTDDKGALIERVLERLSVDPERAVMAGDRSTDVFAARRAGTLAVGCTWGFASPEELSGADMLVDSFPELTRLLERWP